MVRFWTHSLRSAISFSAILASTAAWAAPPTYTFKTLGTLGGASSTAEGVNDFGNVVGVSDLANGSSTPYLYTTTGGMRNLNSITEGPLEVPQRILFGPDGQLYVVNSGTGVAPLRVGSVAIFDAVTGDFLKYFVPPGGEGELQNPSPATFGPDGDLYVPTHSGPDTGRDRIARFNGLNGTYLGDFVPRGSGGVNDISGLTFGPDLDADEGSDLFVRSSDKVLVYSGADGTLLGTFVSPGDGGLDGAGNLLFHDLDGDSEPELLVMSSSTAEVLAYDGQTGEFQGVFVDLSTQVQSQTYPNALTADMQFGPDGDLYITARPSIETINGADPQTQIWHCDGMTGEVLGLFIPPNDAVWSSAAPRLTFDTQGTIYVNSSNTNQILRFEGPLSTNPGEFRDVFVGGVGFELINACDINNSGQIVGIGYRLGRRGLYSVVAAYRYTPPAPGELVGRVEDLGVPGLYFDEYATAINDDGDVAGYFLSPATYRYHAYLWTPETGAVDLGSLNGADTLVTAISNRSSGQIDVAGYAGVVGKQRAWRYSTATGVMQDLGLVGGKTGYSLAWDMNNLGVVTGMSTNRSKLRAFVFSTAMQDLGTLGGNNSEARGINDFGDVVGTADTTTKASTNRHQAFVKMVGATMFKLEPQIVNLPASMSLRIAPWRINNAGQIIGPSGVSGANQAYIITPQ